MLQPDTDPRAPQRKKPAPAAAKLALAEGPRPTKIGGYERKRMMPALIGSAIAIVIVCLMVQHMQQLNAAGGSLDTHLKAHNDAIVNVILHSGPALCTTFGAALMVGLVWAGRPASK